jgi:formylglycine-generating enzyme required for sulfatase activity
LNNPNQPVVGVGWYEAEAFCQWLTAIFGRQYRLPTEVEWERLARGQYGREYPWGNAWQEGLANTAEAEIGQPNAVGLFPGGVSPTGAYDCAGNVWEWCLDWYDKDEDVRVLRGGSWDDGRNDARCAIRGRLHPNFSVNYVGFRVVSPI